MQQRRDFARKGSTRAICKAKKALFRVIKKYFRRLAIGAAENNNLASAVASGWLHTGRCDWRCETAEHAKVAVPAGALGP